jgi:hypothetical protein
MQCIGGVTEEEDEASSVVSAKVEVVEVEEMSLLGVVVGVVYEVQGTTTALAVVSVSTYKFETAGDKGGVIIVWGFGDEEKAGVPEEVSGSKQDIHTRTPLYPTRHSNEQSLQQYVQEFGLSEI